MAATTKGPEAPAQGAGEQQDILPLLGLTLAEVPALPARVRNSLLA